MRPRGSARTPSSAQKRRPDAARRARPVRGNRHQQGLEFTESGGSRAAHRHTVGPPPIVVRHNKCCLVRALILPCGFPYCWTVGLSIRTLLFSDIEGSTSLLDRAGTRYPALLSQHRRIVRAAVEHAGGIEHGTEGDSFFLTFDSPTAGLAAAVEAQRAIEIHDWPDGLRLRVRMGMHVGEVQDDDNDLVGMSINHAARIAAAAHGGQIVLSEAVRDMVRALPDGVEIRPLGTHRLRDVGSVALFQVHHPDLQHDFPQPRVSSAIARTCRGSRRRSSAVTSCWTRSPSNVGSVAWSR